MAVIGPDAQVPQGSAPGVLGVTVQSTLLLTHEGPNADALAEHMMIVASTRL